MNVTQILIIGAGPVGLFLAAELARHGVLARVVDKSSGPSVHSKALGVQPRTLELFADCGLIDEVTRRGRRTTGMRMYGAGRQLVHVPLGELDSPYPYTLILPQNETEAILEELCRERGVIVERDVVCTSVTQNVDGVEVVLARALEDGAEEASVERVRVPWVVGCDGAHSTVREAMGIAYEGEDLGAHIAFADCPAQLDLADDENHLFFTADGFAILIPLPEPGMWRTICSLAHGATVSLTRESFQALFDARLHVPVKIGEPVWATEFIVRQRKVKRYRAGRVFLAGDAAHCHSPLGGRGMNTGLQDAYNLAWKLALVIEGVGRSELLDSYQDEREPVARDLLDETSRTTRAATLTSTVPQTLRNLMLGVMTQFDGIRTRLADNASQLDITYRRSPIVAETKSSLLGSVLTASLEDELPSVADWTDFSQAPRPAARAPDAPVGDTTLHELLYGTQHTVLLFDGAAPTDAGYANMHRIARAVRTSYGRYIHAHVVIPSRAAPPALPPDLSILFDGDGSLHARYGAGAECLYVIRPDGHIGYRSQPADQGKLMAWLATIFV